MHRAVVVGLGSMGRRRIRLLQSVVGRDAIAGVDLSAERRAQTERECGVATFPTLDEAAASIGADVAFVCTSPLGHGAVAMECLGLGLHVFTELNLTSEWYERAFALSRDKGLKMFISSTFLYRKEIEYIIGAVDGRAVNYIYHSGQYLPDWHPWEDYRNFFVSDRRTNACREILAIELPWMLKAFGDVDGIYVMKGKNSALDVDFNDHYMISLRHKSGSKGVFCQDIISRKAVRRLEIYSEHSHVFWDGTPDGLEEFDLESKAMRQIRPYESVSHDSRYGETIIEDAYLNEIVSFFDFIESGTPPRYTFEDDFRTLAMIDGIEEGAYG